MRRNECGGDGCTGDGDACDGVAHRSGPAAAAVVHGGTAVRRSEDGAADECAGGDEETRQRFLRLGDDGELALEGLAGAPEQRFDGSDLDTLVVCDLLIRPAGALAHRKHVAVARRQAVERTVDQLAVDCGQDEFLGGVLADDAHWALRGELQVVGGRAPRATAQHVRADVSGDHGEPGIEAPLACEARQRLPGAGECFLRRVLGLVSVVQSAEAEAEQTLVVARVEVSERRGIAGLTALDERAIAVEVDVVAEAGQLFFTERQLIPSLPPPFVSSHPGGYVTLCPPVSGFLTARPPYIQNGG